MLLNLCSRKRDSSFSISIELNLKCLQYDFFSFGKKNNIWFVLFKTVIDLFIYFFPFSRKNLEHCEWCLSCKRGFPSELFRFIVPDLIVFFEYHKESSIHFCEKMLEMFLITWIDLFLFSFHCFLSCWEMWKVFKMCCDFERKRMDLFFEDEFHFISLFCDVVWKSELWLWIKKSIERIFQSVERVVGWRGAVKQGIVDNRWKFICIKIRKINLSNISLTDKAMKMCDRSGIHKKIFFWHDNHWKKKNFKTRFIPTSTKINHRSEIFGEQFEFEKSVSFIFINFFLESIWKFVHKRRIETWVHFNNYWTACRMKERNFCIFAFQKSK